MVFVSPSSIISFLCIASAAAIPRSSKNSPHDSHEHTHVVRKRLPETWHQPADHPVHALFKRAPGNDGVVYPSVGTPSWSAPYPQTTPDTQSLPAEWVNSLNAAVAAGKIPDIPIPTQTQPSTNPIYPAGSDPNGQTVCSGTYKCRIPGDIWDGPSGVFASSFDDGPLPPTSKLVDFLDANNASTTHFMIGVNIVQNPNEFQKAFEAGHDIGVHTWTHPYMTTLSNVQVLAQLGWTMQLIHNSTGGRVPRYWRPPYGDSDTRTGAIAKEVFGLQTVFWNNDSEDWAATQDSQVETALTKFLAASKNPGLIILEHELSDITVDSFIATFPNITSGGWKFESLAKAINDGKTYQNAQDSDSNDVKPQNILVGGATNASSSTASASTAGSLSAASGTTSSGTLAATSATSSNTVSGSNATASGSKKGSSIANFNTSYLALMLVGVITSLFGNLL